MLVSFVQNMGPWQIVICLIVIGLLFGGKKIPEVMRSLGKGVRSFKDGMNDIKKEIEDIDPEK